MYRVARKNNERCREELLRTRRREVVGRSALADHCLEDERYLEMTSFVFLHGLYRDEDTAKNGVKIVRRHGEVAANAALRDKVCRASGIFNKNDDICTHYQRI